MKLTWLFSGASVYDIHDRESDSIALNVTSSSSSTSGGLEVLDTTAPLKTVFTMTFTSVDEAGNQAVPAIRKIMLIDTIVYFK